MIASLIAALILTPSAHAAVGHDQGNGGDTYSVEFVSTAKKVVNFLRHNGTQEVDIDRLARAVSHTKVESTHRVLRLKGVPKDAINYPATKRIVFSRTRWRKMDDGQRAALVLHEYLGITGAENASYRFSKEVLASFRYDWRYHVDCEFADGQGSINFGIDESAGMDTILLSGQLINGRELFGSVMRPVGEFSQMIRDGNFSMGFEEDEGKLAFLVAMHGDTRPHTMKGSFAAHGQVFSMNCTITKLDTSALELLGGCEDGLGARPSLTQNAP